MKQALTVFAVLALVSYVSGTACAEETPDQLISHWTKANSVCRGSSGEASDRACALREQISAKLEPLGWCYGRKGEFGYQNKWHRCEATSEHHRGSAQPQTVQNIQANVVSVLCTGRTAFYGRSGRSEKTWADEALVFDFGRKMVRHAEENDGPPIIEQTPTSIHWKDESEFKTEGSFSRVALSGRETLHLGDDTIINYYDSCRLAKPRF